uniref:Uncharacterized protein n=1 Tax=Alexandrium andersonii TaxID=327968 RepID=A0A7S2N2Q2_9DINO|mmetsp:Transcript_82159/g.183503  ORF Transcript_82159/g.183503 Transcript_82159/m.183503 type:complete len:155 (+) Transcript_82159:107-571(+)
MGAEASTFCSTSNPGGYLDADAMCSCAPPSAKSSFESTRMQVASATSMRGDRINPWTKDLATNPTCGGCGPPATTAPRDYLADTVDDGAIVLDSREGPVWVDDDQDSRPVDLDPGENSGMRIPEVVTRMETGAKREARDKKALTEKRRGNQSGI